MLRRALRINNSKSTEFVTEGLTLALELSAGIGSGGNIGSIPLIIALFWT